MTCCYILTRQIYVCIHRIPKEGDENKDTFHQTSLNHDGLDIEGFFNFAVLFTFISLFFIIVITVCSLYLLYSVCFRTPSFSILYFLFACLSLCFMGFSFALLVNYSLFCKPSPDPRLTMSELLAVK